MFLYYDINYNINIPQNVVIIEGMIKIFENVCIQCENPNLRIEAIFDNGIYLVCDKCKTGYFGDN